MYVHLCMVVPVLSLNAIKGEQERSEFRVPTDQQHRQVKTLEIKHFFSFFATTIKNVKYNTCRYLQ